MESREEKSRGLIPTDSEIRRILAERKRAEREREKQRRHERLHVVKEIAGNIIAWTSLLVICLLMAGIGA